MSELFTPEEIKTLTLVFQFKRLYDYATELGLPRNLLDKWEWKKQIKFESLDHKDIDKIIQPPVDTTVPNVLMDEPHILTNKIITALLGIFTETKLIPGVYNIDDIRILDFWVLASRKKMRLIGPDPNVLIIDESFIWNERHTTKPPDEIMITSKIFKDKPDIAFISFKIHPWVDPSMFDRRVGPNVIKRYANHMTAWCINLLKPLMKHYRKIYSHDPSPMLAIDSIRWMLELKKPIFDDKKIDSLLYPK